MPQPPDSSEESVVPSSPPRLAWAHLIPSAVIAVRCARWAYRWFNQPPSYAEPVVGAIAWANGRKGGDYAAPLALVVGFVAAFALVSALSSRVARRIGAEAAARVDGLLLVASAPAAAWAAGLLTGRDDSFTLANLSVGAIALVLALAALLAARPATFWDRDGPAFARVLDHAVVVVPAAWLATSALAVAASRGLALWNARGLTAGFVERAWLIAVVAAAAAVVALLLTARTPGGIERTLRASLLAVQLAFPGFFLLLVPRPWQVDGRSTIGYPLTTWAGLLVGGLILAALVDVVRRWRAARGAPQEDALALFATTSVAAAVLFLKSPPVPLPHVPPISVPWLSPDDYHLGEFLVPWWSLAEHGLVPFADYAPARGLVNYVPGAASALFLDGSVASFSALWPFVLVGLLLVAVPVLRWAMGTGWTALALLLTLPPNGFSEIDVLVAVFVALVCRGLTAWSPPVWLTVWVASGTALVLFAPGQGGLAVIATFPLGVWSSVRALRRHRAGLARALGGVAAGAALVAVTPAGPMVVGAIRYGAEQSALNSVAYGVPWAWSYGTSGVNALLYEGVRASWLLVAIWAGVLVVQAALTRPPWRATHLPYAATLFLLTTLFTFRAAGRIDPGPSRLGLASLWALALLLPLLLHASTAPTRRSGALLAWMALAGVIAPLLGAFPAVSASALEPIRDVPRAIAQREPAGPPQLRLGSGAVDPGYVERLSATRALLDRVLDPGETYLDLSGRHAQYFFYDRRPPIESGAVYNLVSEAQQRRAVSALRRSPPPAVLLSADNIVHDGGPIGLRVPLLYRDVLQSRDRDVVVVRDQVWLLRRDRISRLSERQPTVPFQVFPWSAALDSPLYAALQVQDVRAIPAAWGGSAARLEGAMRLIQRLSASPSPGVESLGDGRFRAAGPQPHVRLDVAGAVGGADAGILGFEFRCVDPAGARPVIEVRWAADGVPGDVTRIRLDGRDGPLIVPLDATPAWLLAPRIGHLEIGMGSPDSCRTFEVEDVRLLQRHGADRAAPSSR